MCSASNPAGAEKCTACDFPAIASAQEINKASQMETPRNETSPRDASLLLVAFGVYLLWGAYFAFSNAEWPWFMPPQLDFIGMLLSALGDPIGAYCGGGFLALLGIALVSFPIVLFFRRM